MPMAAKRSADEWKRELQGKPVDVAHDMIVADGTVEAYEAFVALFMQSRFAHEAHEWLILHRRMVAWNDAVLVNTAASYRAFLALYPDSDLAATARKLTERLRYRPGIMPAVMAATGVRPAAATHSRRHPDRASRPTPRSARARRPPFP